MHLKINKPRKKTQLNLLPILLLCVCYDQTAQTLLTQEPSPSPSPSSKPPPVGLPPHCLKVDNFTQKCLKCEDGYYLHRTNVHVQTGKCLKCDQSCKTCFQNHFNCLSCFEGFFWKQVDANGGHGACKSCIPACQKCKNDKSCESCKQDHFLNTTSPTAPLCSPIVCHSRCLECTYNSKVVRECLKCKWLYYLSKEKQCELSIFWVWGVIVFVLLFCVIWICCKKDARLWKMVRVSSGNEEINPEYNSMGLTKDPPHNFKRDD